MILEVKHRIYLWLQFAMDGLEHSYRNCLRVEEVPIKSLPSSVEGATSAELDRLDEFKINPTLLQNSLRDWCGLFVFIDHGRIHLFHQTAKEFLVSSLDSNVAQSGWKWCLGPLQIEQEMARICVKFLCAEDVLPTAQSLVRKFHLSRSISSIVDDDNPIESFVVYSAVCWPSHFRDADIASTDAMIPDILRLYDTGSTLHNLWFKIYWNAEYPYSLRPRMSVIQLALCLRHTQILITILRLGSDLDINHKDRKGRTALSSACLARGDSERLVQILLDAGADIQIKGRYGVSALQIAASTGHEKIVRMLLEAGADVNAEGGYYDNALIAALIEGHDKVIQLLVEAGADPQARIARYQNALIIASAWGREEVVQELRKEGADKQLRREQITAAIDAARCLGHQKVVQMLLDQQELDYQEAQNHMDAGQTTLL